MTALLIGAGRAFALAPLIAIYPLRRPPPAVAVDPHEDLRRRRLNSQPPSRAALLLARIKRVLWRPQNGGRDV